MILLRARYLNDTDPDGWTSWVEGRLTALQGGEAEKFLDKAISKNPGSSLFRAEKAIRYPGQKTAPEGPPRAAPAWEQVIGQRIMDALEDPTTRDVVPE